MADTAAIETVTKEWISRLQGYHPIDRLEISIGTFYVENPYVKVSAAGDEIDKIWLEINSYQFDLNHFLEEILPRTLAHEFHHIIRLRYHQEFHLAALAVNEGLADHFMMEVTGCKKPGYVQPIDPDLLKKLEPFIQRDLFNKDFNHRIWQKGSREQGVPHTFAYRFGFMLVDRYFLQNPEKSALNSFGLDCREIISLFVL